MPQLSEKLKNALFRICTVDKFSICCLLNNADSRQRHQMQQHSQSTADDDVIDKSLPVVAVCSATWKILDGAGVLAVPGVSQYAACRSTVHVAADGRSISTGERAADDGYHESAQPVHADRAYHSTSNRIEIRFTGPVEDWAAAEQYGGVNGRGQERRRTAAGHVLASGSGIADDREGETAATLSGPDRHLTAAEDGRLTLPLAVLHYKGNR